ncbi:MAG: 23S rRNA (uracil(1939)-C(5))-methyltransferase RlmD [Thermodesulforhabdaceae bacterium]
MKKGEEIVLRIDKLAYGGAGIGRANGTVVFVERAFPGALVKAIVLRKKKDHFFARVLEVLEPSPWERDPFCMHESYCGGCLWQRLDYSSQIEWKARQVEESLSHIAGLESVPLLPIEPSPVTRYYRNKMEFAFSARRWLRPDEIQNYKNQELERGCGLGLHVYGAFDRVFDVEECSLESPEAVDILKAVRFFCRESGLPAYGISGHTGFWRFLVIKEAKNTGERLVHIITRSHSDSEKTIDGLAKKLEELCRSGVAITTLVHSVNDQKSQVAVGENSRIIWGSGNITERCLHINLAISAHSFFQTNPSGAEKLYGKIIEWANLSGSEEVWDLYCGTGSIGLLLAKQARFVVGVELVEDAVRDAQKNAFSNGIENCVFYAGDIKDVIKTLAHRAPHLVIIDPPRAGMHPKVVKALLDLAPPRIIAVSCNPTTLARDVGLLVSKYRIRAVQPFDLFPHTPHVECLVDLELN